MRTLILLSWMTGRIEKQQFSSLSRILLNIEIAGKMTTQRFSRYSGCENGAGLCRGWYNERMDPDL